MYDKVYFAFIGNFISLFKSKAKSKPTCLSVPVIDLGTETSRQVIADREKDQYPGHPTTVLLDDGFTMIIVYPAEGHGKSTGTY